MKVDKEFSIHLCGELSILALTGNFVELGDEVYMYVHN